MAEIKPLTEQSFFELLAGLKSSVEELSAATGKPIQLKPMPQLPSLRREVGRG